MSVPAESTSVGSTSPGVAAAPTATQSSAAPTPPPSVPTTPMAGSEGAGVGTQAGAGGGLPTPGSSTPAPSLPPEYVQLQQQYAAAQDQLRQLQPYAIQGYQHYQRQQAEARQRALQAEQQRQNQPWVQVPEFRQEWLALLGEDEHGNMVAKPGAPPDLLQRYGEFSKAYKQNLWDLATNPGKLLQGPVAQLAQQIAMQVVQQHMGQYQARTQADQLLNQHSSWMIATDPNTGGRQLTPAGQMYARFVQQAEASGVGDVGRQHEYAMNLLQLEALRAKLGQAGQQTASEAAKQAFLQQASAGQQNAGPATPASAVGGQVAAPGPNGPRLSLKQMLQSQFEQNGITDKTIVGV